MSWTTKCLLFCERSPDTYLEILPKNPESTSDTKQTCTQAKEFPKQPAPFKPKALKHDSTNHRHPPGPRPPTIPSAPSAGRTESTNEAERTMHQTDHAAGRTIPARRRAIWCVSCVSHVETGFGSSDTLHPCRLVHTPSQDTTWPSPAQRLTSSGEPAGGSAAVLGGSDWKSIRFANEHPKKLFHGTTCTKTTHVVKEQD